MSMQDHERAFYAIGKAVYHRLRHSEADPARREIRTLRTVLETWLDPNERRQFNRYGQLDFTHPGAHVKPLMVWDNDDEIPF